MINCPLPKSKKKKMSFFKVVTLSFLSIFFFYFLIAFFSFFLFNNFTLFTLVFTYYLSHSQVFKKILYLFLFIQKTFGFLSFFLLSNINGDSCFLSRSQVFDFYTFFFHSNNFRSSHFFILY